MLNLFQHPLKNKLNIRSSSVETYKIIENTNDDNRKS